MSEQVTHILLVEDETAHSELVRRAFETHWRRFHLSVAASLAEARACLEKSPPHLILADLNLPDGLGTDLLLGEREALSIPLVVMTSQGDERAAVESMKAGALDYVVKSEAVLADAPHIAERALREWEHVTERKLLQERLVQLQKMEAVGQLGGGITHDFNNLLTAIQGCAEIASEDLAPDHPAQRYLREIQNSAERGASITRQLLVFAKRQPMELDVLNLNDLLLDTVWMLRRLIGENIELVGLPATDLGLAKVDQGLMKQVLVNMAVNARNAMPEGGKLTIETANAVLDTASAQQWAGLAPGHYIKLSVSDSGIGMDEHIKAHLFEPFFTTKEPGKGTGLGLATCYGIVKEMKGDIRVWSEPGQGATLEIYLPREGAAVKEVPVSDSPRLPRGTETVLLVEDEPSVRRLAAEVLQRQGYKVLEADNGEEALRVAQEHGGERIHLLLTDIVMPRMGGKVLAERLTSLFPNIIPLFTSGYAGDDLTSSEDPEALVPFLAKPFLPASLARKVREVLDSASPKR
jgi:signal transduction histidine kinase